MTTGQGASEGHDPDLARRLAQTVVPLGSISCEGLGVLVGKLGRAPLLAQRDPPAPLPA